MTASEPTPRRLSLIPPQHGAWAFLGLPIAIGLTLSDPTPLLIALAVGWTAAYPMSYFILALAKDQTSRRPAPRRFRRPIAVWAALALPCAGVLLWYRPWLVWVGAVYLASFAVNIVFARRRDDRALANDAVFIAQCALMVPVTWAVSVGDRTWLPPSIGAPPGGLWILTLSTALVLAGSTLHVKSLIRERSDPRYRSGSRWFAAASLAASILLGIVWGPPGAVVLPVPFAYFAARSFLMRGPAPRPARIGMIELGGFLLLVGAAVVGTTS